MSALSEYEVEIGGVTHTLQLDEAAAERYGDAAKKVKPANKARSASNKSEA